MFRCWKIETTAGALLGVLLAASDASAQIAVTPTSVTTPFVGPMVSPWFFGGGSYGGGTVAGNFLFGAAQVIRAEGDYNLETAQALPNVEAARSQYIDNLAKWAQVSTRMAEANSAYRAQQLERNRHSPETLTKVAASDLPRELSIDEFDPATGLIVWPEVLATPQFAPPRLDLDRLFEMRAWTGRTPDTTAQIHEDARRMQDILRSKIDRISAGDYVAARKFIDSLDYAGTASHRADRAPDHQTARRR